MKKIFYDARHFKAPYGQYCKVELEHLILARTKPTKKYPDGRPLGRNAILLWLFLVNRASNRRRQGFHLHENCMVKIIPSTSSRYEALKDLKKTGFIAQSKEDNEKWFLTVPGVSEMSEFEEGDYSELSENQQSNSEKTKPKFRTVGNDTYTSTETNYRITESEISENEISDLRKIINRALVVKPWIFVGEFIPGICKKEEMTYRVLSSSIELVITELLRPSNPNNLWNIGYQHPIERKCLTIELQRIFEDFEYAELPPSFETVESSDGYKAIIGVLSGVLSPSNLSIWITPTKGVIEWKGDSVSTLTIWCPNSHFANWVNQNFKDTIETALSDDMSGGPFQVIIK